MAAHNPPPGAADPLERERDAFFHMSPDCPRAEWVRKGQAAHAAGLSFEDFDAWSAGGKTYDARAARDTWRSFRADGGIGPGTLFYMAKAEGWRPDSNAPPPRRLTPEELARQKAEREAKAAQVAAERRALADAAATHAVQRLAAGDQPNQAPPYLAGKGVAPTPDMRQESGALLVPVTRIDGTVRGLQVITADGKKMFSRGTRFEGCLWWARPPADESAPRMILVAEGVATSLTVAAAVDGVVDDAVVACAWSAWNVLVVAAALHDRWPAAKIVISGDNDEAGKRAADEAAAATGAIVRLPTFAEPGAMLNGKPAKDWNDLQCLAGLDEVRHQLLDAPPTDTPTAAEPPAYPSAAPAAAATQATPAPESPHIDAPDDSGGRRSALDVVLALTADLELFHDAAGTGYFAAEYDGRREVWAIQSRAGADLVQRRYLANTGRGLPAQPLRDVLATLDARARFEGRQRDVFLRVARFPDRVLIDLADDRWRVLEVTGAGWRVLDRSPVPFVRRAGMAPLPEPQRGGSVAELRKFVNVADAEFRLVVAWLLGALGGRGPFAVLILQAEQGAGKSTVGRVLRALVDPADVPLKAPPRTADDWVIAAAVSYVLALDNLSGLTNDQSDVLCRLATGAGMSKRRLYTDLDEVQLHLCRPVLLNGIDAIATRPDLADRSLVVTLPTIPAARRRREAVFWTAFEAARPRLLGALLDAVAGALRCAGNAPPPDLPRMADFAAWISAAEPALNWPAGAFLAAYRANIEGAAEAAVEASPVGVAVLSLLSRDPSVTYVATDLMPALEHAAPVWAPRSPAWPRSPRGLTDSLRRLTAPLRQLGIEVFEHRDARGRWITLRRLSQPSANSPGVSA